MHLKTQYKIVKFSVVVLILLFSFLTVWKFLLDQGSLTGGRAPEFALVDSNGKTHRLSQMAGSQVLIHFWASWCEPCIEELPKFVNLAKKLTVEKVKFVLISMDDNWEDAHSILPSKDLPRNVLSLLDTEAQSPADYGSYQYPESYLLGLSHEIKFKWVGPQQWDHESFIKHFRQILGKES